VRVKVKLEVDGAPLRRAYVEHIVLGAGTDMYITDLEGRVRDKNFDEGIESLTPNADIRIICQNPITRVNDGNNFNIGVYQDRSIQDGDLINLRTPAGQHDYYNILNQTQIVYEIIHQPLSFFQNLPDPDFPLGRQDDLRATRDQAKRIDLIFPDHSVAPLSWTEPKRLGDNFPLLHIKSRAEETQLFGDGGEFAVLIPHELTHAMHFATLSEAQRGNAQDKYANFILTSPFSGLGPFHQLRARTTPEVAYIEAGGFFGENFAGLLMLNQGGRQLQPQPITEAIQAQFVFEEWFQRTQFNFPINVIETEAIRRLSKLVRRFFRIPASPPPTTFPIALNRQFRKPAFTGGDVEGAVYGAIFVDFAASVGLDFAASSYFKANAITFGEYRDFINQNHPEHAATLETVRVFWGL
jgi:hypothetical protein